MREHLRAKPEKPVFRKLILTDATPAALQSALTGNGQSIGIISDEAGMIFGGYLIQALALFNSLWSGKRDLTVDRADESYVIRDARVTVLLQVQPPVFGKYLGKHREKAVGSGWLPRFIVTQPISMQGNRFGNGANPGQYGLDSFHRRMNELLRLPVILDEEGNLQRKVLKFAPETQSRWQQIANDIEAMLAPYQYYSGIREFATRFPDNIARLAALFHAFSGNEGDISLDTLNQAVIVFAWYSEEALRLFNRNQVILPEDLEHANLLLPWLQGCFQRNGGEPIRKNILYQRAPNPVRPKGKMNAALNHLLSWGRIQIGKMGKTTYVYPGQNLFTPSI